MRAKRAAAMLVLVIGMATLARADYVRIVYSPSLGTPVKDKDLPKGKEKEKEKEKEPEKLGTDKVPMYLPTRAVTYVLLKHPPKKKNETRYIEAEQRFGKSYLADTPEIQLDYATMLSPAIQFEKRRQSWLASCEEFAKTNSDEKACKKHRLTKGAELADEAISMNLLPQYNKLMAELVPLDPAAFAYTPPEKYPTVDKNDTAAFWAKQLHLKTQQAPSSRFTLLHNYPSNQTAEVVRIQKLLDDHFQLMQAWFVLRHVKLPVPASRQCVVLFKEHGDFNAFHKTFESPPLNWDGFCARREGIVAMCGTPLDDAYNHLNRELALKWTSGWNREDILKGLGWLNEKTDKVNFEMSTKALLQKQLLDDAWQATITNNCTRQLLGAFEILPASVDTPEWLTDGLASHFETPKGAPWPGTGMTHWFYLPIFRDWQKEDKLDAPDQALMKVITDGYYKQAGGTKEEQREALLRARVMSWSLTYFLMSKDQMESTLRFFNELAQLPRDLQFDPEVHKRCFARAYKLTKSETSDELDPDKVRDFAGKWYQYFAFTDVFKQKQLSEAFQIKRDKRK